MQAEEKDQLSANRASLMEAINGSFLADENQLMETLLADLHSKPGSNDQLQPLAEQLIYGIRSKLAHSGGLQALLSHYDLSTQEGVALMCLAEALLRIPDSDTVDALIADKLSVGQWQHHLGKSDSVFVNASTWALMLSGRLLKQDEQPEHLATKLINRLDAPIFRAAIKQAMQLIAEQFVMGADIGGALQRAQQNDHYLYSYDMLGEAALTAKDAEFYQQAYLSAISEIGEQCDTEMPIHRRVSISVKLSALYPRYEYKRQSLAVSVLVKRLLELAMAAKGVGIGLTMDAEEADRLNLSLQIFEKVYLDEALSGWPGLGLAVQAYQKRARPVLDYLLELAQQGQRRIPVRLVKGAYWDTEIKRAQQQGLSGYPVFTQKNNTDVSYLVCSQFLLGHQQWLYPQFATHNAHTVASILSTSTNNDFEFQRLHGMGEALYEQLLTGRAWEWGHGDIYCRVYSPVGVYRELLPYLVRRLLENGANSSFVNQMAHPERYEKNAAIAPDGLVLPADNDFRYPEICLPGEVFGSGRMNSSGVNFADPSELKILVKAIIRSLNEKKISQPLVDGEQLEAEIREVFNPAARHERIGISQILRLSQTDKVEQALEVALSSWSKWNDTSVEGRAEVLQKAADLFEMYRAELIGLCVKEAGKTVVDALADVREAIDFLRYYAAQAVEQMSEPQVLPGFAGESNELLLQGRGVFLCVSPWNFPVAIFTGQIAAALVTGNCVLAKPSSLTTLTAQRVVSLLYQAGVPVSVLHYLPCDAEVLSASVLNDSRLAGVAFTGSCQTATTINRQLAERDGPIAALIAETGGQNVLMADSSAQPEQLVKDVITSAFNSAGQRCSALRVLYVQTEIADRVIELLTGAMGELRIGNPLEMATDVGPVISAEAQAKLQRHIGEWQQKGALLHQCELPADCEDGYFVAPTLIKIDSIRQLSREHFGPVLHVVSYQFDELQVLLEEINNTGYGLTFGFHSRIEQRIAAIQRQVRVGNVYINRDTIGAVVGAQPFGGQGLSGTGPKAGGPHYLLRFTTEQARTVNTAAVGGNTQLLNQDNKV
jgi:RHH-type transcriptional regulator, proline utilization regulon repressor / proline dehydrogenase / delta 1-pyrroline-5-carboxylate dehydrogenase